MHLIVGGTCEHVGEPVCVRPGGVLAGSVRDYNGYREHLSGAVRRREFPSSNVLMFVCFGDPITVVHTMRGRTGTYHGSLITGLRDTFMDAEVGGPQHGVHLRLSPLDAYAIFGVPMHLVSNEQTDLGSLLGRRGTELTERLAEATTWPGRFELLDRMLTRFKHEGPRPDPAVEWAWRRLATTGGNVRVSTLSGELGLHRRHLLRRFGEQVGLGPKTVARIFRFERALDLLSTERSTVAEVAARAGYSDQAHLTREFETFTRSVPSQLVPNQPVTGQLVPSRSRADREPAA